MERTAILDADAVIAVSEGTKADILRAYPEVDPDRIHVIYNGIDLAEYQKTERDQGASRIMGSTQRFRMLLFVGRITRQKGVTHLVDAIRYMPTETQVVLCAGAPGYAGDCGRDAEEGGSMRSKDHPRIVWIEKMVTKPEAIQLYSNARVFCCPSVYEPFGIINLEAMACRAPVVASATGGIKEVVVDGQNRIPGAVRPGSRDEFSARSRELRKGSRGAYQRTAGKDPEKCRRFGEAGRRRVEEHFQLDRDCASDDRTCTSA